MSRKPSAATPTPAPKKAAPDSKPRRRTGLTLATDGGQRFAKAELPDITRIGDARATSKNKLVLTGADDKCQASIFATPMA